MAEFLTTSGVNFRLEGIVKNAKDRLVLVSPYLKINSRLRQMLEEQDRFKIDIRVIYGKSELKPDEVKWLRGLTSVRSSFCQNLHAKCFLNESEALITSMNLYEFSQVNNEEMGILISKEHDPELYADVAEDVQRLLRASDEVRFEVEIVPPESAESRDAPKKTKPKAVARKPAPQKSAVDVPEMGQCIRCGNELRADPAKPYCRDCYDVWKQYENPDYEEKHCHICGKPNKSTLNKPTCYACYRKYSKVLAFPAAAR